MLNRRLPILALLRVLLVLPVLLVLVLGVSTAHAQGAAITPQQAAPFMGTWVFTMTAPEHFKGSQQTVKVWDENGKIAASLQMGKFPASTVTGVYRDGDMLLLTISLDAPRPILENGVPLRTVILLTPDGDGLNMAQMFGNGPTVKRGLGKKQ